MTCPITRASNEMSLQRIKIYCTGLERHSTVVSTARGKYVGPEVSSLRENLKVPYKGLSDEKRLK